MRARQLTNKELLEELTARDKKGEIEIVLSIFQKEDGKEAIGLELSSSDEENKFSFFKEFEEDGFRELVDKWEEINKRRRDKVMKHLLKNGIKE